MNDPEVSSSEDAASEVPTPAVIVGLGNPGEQYHNTRHNLGFEVVDELARRRAVESWTETCAARVLVAEDVHLVKPQTYMNRSGFALRALRDLHGYPLDRILIVYDDVVLPLGAVRLRGRGRPAGHRGMESIVENLRSEDVPRLRLGIGGEEPAEGELADFVLEPFSDAEREIVAQLIERGADACESWLEHGLESTMNRFNGKIPGTEES